MKLTLPTAFAAVVILGSGVASAETIMYTFTGLPGRVDTCKWFDDNINQRDTGSLTRQTDLLFNRVALPVDQTVAITGTAVTARGEQLVDFNLGKRTVCGPAAAIYGPTPEPPGPPTPLPT